MICCGQHAGELSVVHIEVDIFPLVWALSCFAKWNHIPWNLCVMQVHEHWDSWCANKCGSFRQSLLKAIVYNRFSYSHSDTSV